MPPEPKDGLNQEDLLSCEAGRMDAVQLTLKGTQEVITCCQRLNLPRTTPTTAGRSVADQPAEQEQKELPPVSESTMM